MSQSPEQYGVLVHGRQFNPLLCPLCRYIVQFQPSSAGFKAGCLGILYLLWAFLGREILNLLLSLRRCFFSLPSDKRRTKQLNEEPPAMTS